MRLVYLIFFFLVETTMASSQYDAFIEDVAAGKKNWRRISDPMFQDDSLISNFVTECNNRNDKNVRACGGYLKESHFYYDSTVFDTTGKRTFYELAETVFDENEQIKYQYDYLEGYKYALTLFNHGRLAYEERGCDTLQLMGKEKCLIEAKNKQAKRDSLGRFIFYQRAYLWNATGRLTQRTLYYSLNYAGLNGTYKFRYGSPCDTVYVDPIDYEPVLGGRTEEGRYNGSFGMIPEMGDPEYREFAEDPYSSIRTFDYDSILVRQQKRCEDYKKSLKKNLKK